MKRILYFIPIIIVTGILLYYLSRTLSPFNSNAELDMKNITIMESLLLVFLWAIFSMLVALVDKLVFKKFYQPPNYKFALRQGFGISILILANLHLRIIDDWSLQILILTLAAYIGFLGYDFHSTRSKENEKDSEKSDEADSK